MKCFLNVKKYPNHYMIWMQLWQRYAWWYACYSKYAPPQPKLFLEYLAFSPFQWLPFAFWIIFRIYNRRFSILSIFLSNLCWWVWSLAWLPMIVCWLARSRSIWTSVAFGITSADEGSLEGSFSVSWLWLD